MKHVKHPCVQNFDLMREVQRLSSDARKLNSQIVQKKRDRDGTVVCAAFCHSSGSTDLVLHLKHTLHFLVFHSDAVHATATGDLRRAKTLATILKDIQERENKLERCHKQSLT